MAEHPHERLVIRLLIGTLVGLIFLYIYFVSITTLNVIARKDAMRRADDLTSSIGALEQQYFALARSVTPESAQELGLVPVSNTAYVYAPGNVGMAN